MAGDVSACSNRVRRRVTSDEAAADEEEGALEAAVAGAARRREAAPLGLAFFCASFWDDPLLVAMPHLFCSSLSRRIQTSVPAPALTANDTAVENAAKAEAEGNDAAAFFPLVIVAT